MFALQLNVCSDVVNFKLNARKESKKVVLSSEARAALRSLLSPPSKKNPLNSPTNPFEIPAPRHLEPSDYLFRPPRTTLKQLNWKFLFDVEICK